MESYVPPGFRFHPTEEELVRYYLNRKVNSQKIDLDVITDIDLYRMEPWDIEGRCKLGYEEQKEWYFFSHKDRKYPTGSRTNRATAAGFWKATGRDKAVFSKEQIIGMRKTLVFYKGRAPNGRKTDWIMHEYRLQTCENAPTQEEGWVVCRAFKKPCPSHKQGFETWSNAYNFITRNRNFEPPAFHGRLNPIFASNSQDESTSFHQTHFPKDQELMISNQSFLDTQLIHELPQLDSPSISASFVLKESFDHQNSLTIVQDFEDKKRERSDLGDDWTFFDKMVVPQSFDSSSYACQSDEMMPNDEEILMGCFSDL